MFYFSIMKDIKKLLGKRIKELRKERNLSQDQLSELVGIDSRSISHIENGDSFPSKSLLEIAKALNVSLPDLFEFEHLKYDVKYKKNYIINSLDNISNADLDVLFRIIKSMN